MMQSIVFLVALLNCSGQEEGKGPFDAIQEPIRHLSAGMTGFAEGKDLAEALKPWRVLGPDEKEIAKVREQLKTAGAATIACVGLEFELYYLKEGKAVYSVNVTVFADGREAGIVEFGAHSITSGPSKSFGIGDCKDSLAGLGAAAEAIVKHLADEKSDDPPFADPKKVAKACGGLGDAGGGMIAEARKRLSEKRAEIAAVKYDEVRLQMDDILMVALDSSGKAVGTFKSEFTLEGDALHWKLRRFKSAKR